MREHLKNAVKRREWEVKKYYTLSTEEPTHLLHKCLLRVQHKLSPANDYVINQHWEVFRGPTRTCDIFLWVLGVVVFRVDAEHDVFAGLKQAPPLQRVEQRSELERFRQHHVH